MSRATDRWPAGPTKTEKVSIRLPALDYRTLNARRETNSQLVRTAIKAYLDEHADVLVDEPEAVVTREPPLPDDDTTRFTFRCCATLLADLETLVEHGLAPTRSAAIRDAVHSHLTTPEGER